MMVLLDYPGHLEQLVVWVRQVPLGCRVPKGLTLSMALMEMQDQEVRLDSRENRGYVVLMDRGVAEDHPDRKGLRGRQAGQVSLGREEILEHLDREAHQVLLALQGTRVLVAAVVMQASVVLSERLEVRVRRGI